MTKDRLEKIRKMAVEGDAVSSPVVYELIEALEAEREHCARIAESPGCMCKAEEIHDGCCGVCGSRIAKAIREAKS